MVSTSLGVIMPTGEPSSPAPDNTAWDAAAEAIGASAAMVDDGEWPAPGDQDDSPAISRLWDEFSWLCQGMWHLEDRLTSRWSYYEEELAAARYAAEEAKAAIAEAHCE